MSGSAWVPIKGSLLLWLVWCYQSVAAGPGGSVLPSIPIDSDIQTNYSQALRGKVMRVGVVVGECKAISVHKKNKCIVAPTLLAALVVMKQGH